MGVHIYGAVIAPAAGVVSEAVLGIITLGTFLVFIVCLGLHEGWDHTIGYGIRWVADQIHDVAIDVGVYTIRPFEFVADALYSVDKRVTHALAVAALNTEKAATAMWHLTAEVFWWSVHETKALAVGTFHALEHAVTVTVPNAARWARREAVTLAHRIVHVEAAERRAVDHELRHLARVAEADAMHGIRAAEHALDWSETKVGHLERDLSGLTARVNRIARQLTPAAIVALIGATIFKDFGLGWLRCGNVGNVGRRLCGLETGLLDALLIGTLAVEGSISLVSMAHELVDISDEIVPAVTRFVREFSGVTLRTPAEQGFE